MISNFLFSTDCLFQVVEFGNVKIMSLHGLIRYSSSHIPVSYMPPAAYGVLPYGVKPCHGWTWRRVESLPGKCAASRGFSRNAAAPCGSRKCNTPTSPHFAAVVIEFPRWKPPSDRLLTFATDTPGTWTVNLSQSGNRSVGFDATAAARPTRSVPDGAATASLLGGALILLRAFLHKIC